MLLPFLNGARIWVAWINARGGLNGHRVQFLVYDDRGDPAKHKAQVQEAVERRGVLAFLMNGDIVAGRSSVEYLTARRIPLIGTDSGDDYVYSSPMYFPHSSAGTAGMQSLVFSTADQVVPRGRTKLGTISCVESDSCGDLDRVFGATAASAGLQLVYRARASVASPDFTAECLAAQRSGVEVLWVSMDTNSVLRVAAACARQGFNPIYGVGSANTVEAMRESPSFDGLAGTALTFPYFQTGTPATDEFAAAVKAHGSGLEVGLSTAAGWAAGKLLERAATALLEPPTTAALLDGLWSMRAETLGGLVMPLTFTRDRPAPRQICWFPYTVRAGAWVSPDGFRLHCRRPTESEGTP